MKRIAVLTSGGDAPGMNAALRALGHIQRGGVPCAFDRLIATELGAAATAHLKEGQVGVLLGIVRGEVATIPLTAAALAPKPLDARLFELAGVLAR